MRTALAILLCLTLAPVLAGAVEIELRTWPADVGGEVRVDEPSAAGDLIDFNRDLGLDEDGLLEARLIFRPTRRTSVRLAYADLPFAGAGRIQRTLSFGGQTFELDSQVTSSLDLDYGRLGFAWQFLSPPGSKVRFGPLVEIKGLRGTAGLAAEIPGIVRVEAAEQFEVAFAAAGVVLDVEPSRKLHIYAEWTTLVSADEGDLTDAEAGVRYYVLDVLGLAAGYRKIEIDADDGGDVLRLDVDGIFFGAVLRF